MKSLIIPVEGRGDVETLLSLTGEQVRRLDGVLEDRGGLKQDKRTFRRVSEALGISLDNALGILNAIDNLRRQREQFEISDTSLFEDLSTIRPVEGDAREALIGLLRKSEEDYFVEKVGSLRHAVAPQVTSMRTIVDARPVFNRDRSKVDGLVLLTFLELTTHDPGTDEIRSSVTQLDRKQLKALRSAVEDAEKKLDRLTETLGGLDVYE